MEGARRRRAAQAFLRGVTVLPITRTVVRRNATIRLDLRQRGRTIRVRGLDLLIAATALTYGLTVVTRNTADYGDVPGNSLH